ncbi:MAG: hypothetical protein R3C62_15980 [Chloroflexota bacterium]
MIDDIEVSIKLPRVLWAQLVSQAKTADIDESILLAQAVENFLANEAKKIVVAEQLSQECDLLAGMSFDDIGTEEEWLLVQNEALTGFETELE